MSYHCTVCGCSLLIPWRYCQSCSDNIKYPKKTKRQIALEQSPHKECRYCGKPILPAWLWCDDKRCKRMRQQERDQKKKLSTVSDSITNINKL